MAHRKLLIAMALLWLGTAAAPVRGQVDTAAVEAPNRNRVIAAADGRALWIVQDLDEGGYRLLQHAADDDPNVIYKGMTSKGRPIALASANTAAADTVYVVYTNHTVQAIEWGVDEQTGQTIYNVNQLSPLPTGGRLVDFAADADGLYALLARSDATGSQGTEAPNRAADPNATGSARRPLRPRVDQPRALYALERGRWRKVALPGELGEAGEAITMQLAAADRAGGGLALLVQDAAEDAAYPFAVYRRAGEQWQRTGFDRGPVDPWQAVSVRGHGVVVERPNVTGPLVASVWREGERLDVCGFAMPAEPGLPWAALGFDDKLAVVVRDASGRLHLGVRDLTRPPGPTVELRPLEVRERTIPALNRHIAVLGLMLMAIVFMLAVWRRDPRAAMVNLPKELVAAEPSRRFGAAGLDLIAPLVVVSIFVGESPVGLLTSLIGFFFQPAQIEMPVLVVVGLYVVHTLVTEMFTGVTLGKRILGLRVVSNDGSAINLWQALLRNAVKPVELMAWPLLLFILLNPGRQRMGDLAARTAVVRQAGEKDKSEPDKPSDSP